MKKRTEILEKCPEEFAGELNQFIDDLEGEVNHAKSYLDDIEGAGTLHLVEDCLARLQEISSKLY